MSRLTPFLACTGLMLVLSAATAQASFLGDDFESYLVFFDASNQMNYIDDTPDDHHFGAAAESLGLPAFPGSPEVMLETSEVSMGGSFELTFHWFTVDGSPFVDGVAHDNLAPLIFELDAGSPTLFTIDSALINIFRDNVIVGEGDITAAFETYFDADGNFAIEQPYTVPFDMQLDPLDIDEICVVLSVTPVPEPTGLLLPGLFALFGLRRLNRGC